MRQKNAAQAVQCIAKIGVPKIPNWEIVGFNSALWIRPLMGKVTSGRGASEKHSAVGFCLGSGLFGSYNSD